MTETQAVLLCVPRAYPNVTLTATETFRMWVPVDPRQGENQRNQRRESSQC